MNYVKVFLFLLGALVFWGLFGGLADYAFPFGQALELVLACFRGTIASRVNNLQQQFQGIEVIPQPNNKKQVQKLNNLESQAWLYQGVLERLGEDPSANHEKIARTIEGLEFKRNEILKELEPRRPQKYRTFLNIQNQARSLLASQAERDYERLDRIVTNTVLFTRSQPRSNSIFSEVIRKVSVEITQNASYISPYRLRLAYKINELIEVLSTKLFSEANNSTNVDSNEKLINELKSQLATLAKQFNRLLQNKQGDVDKLNRQIENASNLSRTVSDLQQTISEREKAINVLRRSAQDSIESANRKQAQVDNLRNQLFQLDQQNANLRKQIEQTNENNHNREMEVRNLESEKKQLSNQKIDLQTRYQSLLQQYQQKQNEIADLSRQVDSLSQQVRRVETREKISIEDYKEIVNQSDYYPVKAHMRNGSPVRAHYRRRRPNR